MWQRVCFLLLLVRNSYEFVQQTSSPWGARLDSRAKSELLIGNADEGASTFEEVKITLCELLEYDRVEEAAALVRNQFLSVDSDFESDAFFGEYLVSMVLHRIAVQGKPDSVDKARNLLSDVIAIARDNKALEFEPSTTIYNSIILAWSKSGKLNAGMECDKVLNKLWTLYEKTGEEKFLPNTSSYISTMTAWSRSGEGLKAAQRVESILEEMESLNGKYNGIGPCTVAVNVVLNTWSKLNDGRAAERCELILARMEDLFMSGRHDVAPDTVSFNTVIDTLAKSRIKGCERRAESLLEHMDELSSAHEHLRERCKPDHVSFNVVLNAWARSKETGAARRADAILRHMERRWQNGETNCRPDTTGYNTVLTAWARSNEAEASTRVEALIKRMEKASNQDKFAAKPNTVSYNILINTLIKSKARDCCSRVLSVLKRMKADGKADVVSYTSCIDALAKEATYEASVNAERLLEELEGLYEQEQDESLRPNIRTYTAVVNAIARSRQEPERAEHIGHKLEKMYREGDFLVQPDTVFFDAVINAFGWATDYPRKGAKCFDLYEQMVESYDSGLNRDVKPDVITCNSVLNACAYDDTASQTEKGRLLHTSIQTLEYFQSRAPEFGKPNHITYANALTVIMRQMESSPKREDLAETIFWQCCESGNTSVLVVNKLFKIVTYARLKTILGEALLSGEEERLRFDPKVFPKSWSRELPAAKKRRRSRPSMKSSAYRKTKRASKSMEHPTWIEGGTSP